MEKSMQLDPHGGRYDIRPEGGVLYVRELENRQLALLRSALASYSVFALHDRSQGLLPHETTDAPPQDADEAPRRHRLFFSSHQDRTPRWRK